MKKHGFTLAEMLVTLGIVSVVAAITMPGLVTNWKNQANADKLADCVQTLESGFKNAIVQENVRDLSQTSFYSVLPHNPDNDPNDPTHNEINENFFNAEEIVPAFIGNLARYINVSSVGNVNFLTYYGAADRSGNAWRASANGPFNIRGNRISREGLHLNEYFAFKLKNGAIVFLYNDDDEWERDSATGAVRSSAPGDDGKCLPGTGILRDGRCWVQNTNNRTLTGSSRILAAGGSHLNKLGTITIDVNGRQGPNRYGRDIFWFQLDANGSLFPMGGKDYALYHMIGRDEYKNNYWKSGNHALYSCSADAVADYTGEACTGRLVENGYKVDY